MTETPPQYAIRVNRDWVPADYDEKVDETILSISYKPDVFQKQAFYFLTANRSVFVAAHTSSGKTLVAEYAISLSQLHGTRTIYTSPIKALSNQKFYDFKRKFESVGLMTGDVQVSPTAQCLIMTTEILRNLLYKNSEIIKDTEFVVFDEVHYINDADRGVVWEESIIMLPKHITLVMLSATIPNALEFTRWIGRTKQQCIYVITTDKRAVPLEYAIYFNSEVFALEEARGQTQPSNFTTKLPLFTRQIMPGKSRYRILDLTNFVVNRRLTPSIFFSFSKKACNALGKALETLNLTTPIEKRRITEFIDRAVAGLREEDKYLPQIVTMREQAYKGIAVHHGGLLPLVKECTELLFSQNLIRILIATETFAMGVNMPAKCCVFLGITKIDGKRFRTLTSGEFTQMSGRAGRRGMDKVGTVIIADQKMPSIDTIRKMIHGATSNLGSKFKLSFSLILTALCSNIEVEELLKKSFKENEVQKSLLADLQEISVLESAIPEFECAMCKDIFELLENVKFICEENAFLLKGSVNPGACFVLKDNSVVRCDSVSGTTLQVTEVDEPLSGKLFNKTDPNATISVTTEKYLSAPPTIRLKKNTTSTSLNDLLFLVEDGSISFKYNITEVCYLSTVYKIELSYKKICESECLSCPEFEKHYCKAVEYVNVLQKINALKRKHSRESLAHINEYSARCEFLRQHEFIDEQGATLKGRVAAEIRTINEVFATELIFNNLFEGFNAMEVATAFSAMISEEPLSAELELDEEIRDKIETLNEAYDDYKTRLDKLGIPAGKRVNHGMSNAVYAWCKGASLGVIVAKHGVQEGSFVRLILRLEECSREMIAVAQMIGDTVLETKFNEVSLLIKRDVVFTPSLYID